MYFQYFLASNAWKIAEERGERHTPLVVFPKTIPDVNKNDPVSVDTVEPYSSIQVRNFANNDSCPSRQIAIYLRSS